MSAAFPRVATLSVDARASYSDAAARLVSCCLLVPMAVAAIFAKPLFTLWVGSTLAAPMAPIGSILILSFWLNAVAIVYVVQLQATGRPSAITKNYLIQVPIYLPLLFLSMKTFGLVGCAGALCVRSMIDLVMQCFSLEKKFPPYAILAQALVLSIAVFQSLYSEEIALRLLCLVLIIATLVLSAPKEMRFIVNKVLAR